MSTHSTTESDSVGSRLVRLFATANDTKSIRQRNRADRRATERHKAENDAARKRDSLVSHVMEHLEVYGVHIIQGHLDDETRRIAAARIVESVSALVRGAVR